MILLDTYDNIIRVAISTKDMLSTPTTMTLKNVQSKETTTISLYDVSTNERTGIYNMYVIRNSTPTPEQDVTYITLPDGTYEYSIGEEIGLLQIGIPTLDKQEYTTTENNAIYYNE